MVGKTGTGKSSYLKARLADELAAGARVVVFDPCDEYSTGARRSAYVDPGPLPQRCYVPELEADDALLDRPDLALAVVTAGDPEEVAADFETVSDLVRETGNLVFVIEEVGYFAEHCQERLKAVATMYRHQGVVAVFVAQRATQIPLTARAQASELVAFRQDEVADLEALAARIDQDFADRVSRLRVGQFETWRDSTELESSPKEQ